MTRSTTDLLAELLDFVEDERACQDRALLDVWERPVEDKLRTGWSQDFTRLEPGPDGGCLWAWPGDAESRFREGDLLVLHAGRPLEDSMARRLLFEFEDDDRWLLRGKQAAMALDAWNGASCFADPDTIDLTHYYHHAIDDLRHSDIGRDIVLPLLAGERELAFDDRDVRHGRSLALDAGLDDMQAEAVGMALGAETVACIQGPPGTGKTRVLALAVRAMVARGERVLVTSHTHMAINNALNKVHAHGVPVVKVGPTTQVRGLGDGIERFERFFEWEDRPTDGYVVGATPFATCSVRLEGCTFDTIVFDEASQVTVPLALMAMRTGRRYVFVGDQAQLPPVLLSRSILSDDVPSMFAELTSRRGDHAVMLNRTYRMNRWLADWPSRTHYRGELRSAGDNRERRLALAGVTAQPAHLAAMLDPAACGVFVPTQGLDARTRNLGDARLVVDLCVAAAQGGLALERIGVVTPYRAQGRAIRKLLAERFGHDAARRVVADTVERMQGQERELVILSLATADDVFLGQVAEFFFQAERLNVAITRAESKLVVIGPWLDTVPPVEHEKLRRWIEQYIDLQRHLVRVDV